MKTLAFEELKQAKASLVKRFADNGLQDNFQSQYTEIMDQYFRQTHEESINGQALFTGKHPFALVAVGGYGRKELCLHSDLDVMILFRSKIPDGAKVLTEEIFFPLWDLGLDIGYGIRSIKDCISLSLDDFQALTSLMDARFVCGDSTIYLTLMEDLQKRVLPKRAASFGRWLEDQDKIRGEEFGDASYMLEPHLKEGIGGLRDYHHILWLARAFFNLGVPRDLEYYGRLTHKEYKELRDNLAFIWLVRNHLHMLSGRRNDRLHFHYQDKIAEKTGFKDKKNFPAVEQFLGRLHCSMSAIKSLHRSFICAHLTKRPASGTADTPTGLSKGLYVHQQEIYFESSTVILSDPHILMDIFERRSVSGIELSLESLRLVREFTYLVDDGFRRSKRTVAAFLNIISNKFAHDALDQMFETGLLDAFIPEFGEIKDRVQYDAYHMFPVGRHLLETFRHLKEAARQKELVFPAILSELPDTLPLFLAALLHDIGKTGENHSIKGADMAEKILKRWACDRKVTEDVVFLIKNHLLLAETATRRDLNDEKIVVSCCRIISDVNRLKMLYLLTWADSKATGPKVWNSWTSNLVQELFFKILHILERKELATVSASQIMEDTLSEVRRLMAGNIEGGELEAFFDIMTTRYILNVAPREITRHIAIVRDFKSGLSSGGPHGFLLDTREKPADGCWEIIFTAKDRPGVFSELAGVFALNNINILSADIYTWRDGTVVDIFRVSRPLDPIHPEETWHKVEKDLENTFKGRLSLGYRLGQKARPFVSSEQIRPSRPPKVITDNKTSDFFTIIEVFADDRVGLLYEITQVLSALKLDIRIAKIATKADQIADIFYVRDFDGQKIEDEGQLKEIREALHYRLANRPIPYYK
ncbi:Bifunctional uridylyltransferase/uridylyl-removing enzyme [uncultured Desulfobacterium sp.]|uniref:Bifunctional uridylyltransferase/uridylyl-removing enzyme n=1 Tax=uncultured Desulfobacterium sp. TaxID=201089 RepID=A0A445MR82_9BACT|nr:Bifunctional uridylyltransferase/uridylyl-removing enzyme [uncultured Desulfobacterium sp.]